MLDLLILDVGLFMFSAWVWIDFGGLLFYCCFAFVLFCTVRVDLLCFVLCLFGCWVY